MAKKNKSYNIRAIFEQMELDLIANMNKTFLYHKSQEAEEGFKWEQWQRGKLRALNSYRKKNRKIIKSYKEPVRECINNGLKNNYSKGGNKFIDAVKRIGNKIKNIFSVNVVTEDIKGLGLDPAPDEKDFFGMNDKKLEALQKSVTADIEKASSSVLRKMDDVYRQTIYKSHVYLQSGAVTISKAVDMATKDFLSKGINNITYSNGAHVNIASYAEMCLITANHRAMLLGEGAKRDEWNIHLVVVSAHANTCEMCEPWQGQVLIDDVFSNPSKEYINKYKSKYKLVSEAIASGLLHPNCRHNLTTYFEGITSIPKIPNGKAAIKLYEAEQKQRKLERQIRQAKRLCEGCLDLDDKLIAQKKLKQLEKAMRLHLKDNPSLRRNREKERVKV